MTDPQVPGTAAAETARLLASGFGAEIKGRETRLRAGFREALALVSPIPLETVTEWRPLLPFWPEHGGRRLGGFDLVARHAGEGEYSLVAELKWTHYGYVNALDETPWDAYKLAHAVAAIPSLTNALLVTLAPMKAWNRPPRFIEFYTDTTVSTRSLLTKHEWIWRWCLSLGAGRPTKLPPYLQTEFIAKAPLLLNGEPHEIRVASVQPSGEPWLELDREGMPVSAT